MEQQYATLTGSEGPVKGIIKNISHGKFVDAWRFNSIDGTLDITIAQHSAGHWEKIAGTEPYLFGWVDELAEQVTTLKH